MSYASNSVWSAPSPGGLLKTRAARKVEKARGRYIEERTPADYSIRKMRFNIAISEAHDEIDGKIKIASGEINELDVKLCRATSQRALNAMTARADALKALIDSYRLALSTTLEALFMQYRDIVEYEAGLASFG